MGPGFIRARTRSGLVPQPGMQVHVRADAGRAHFFDRDTGKSLGVSL